MNTETIQSIAQSVVAIALGINPNDLSLSAKIYDFPEWDSLGHLQIVQKLEEKLNVSVDDDETFERLTRFDAIVDFVNRHVNKGRRN